jgi:YbbR domain-containing protein
MPPTDGEPAPGYVVGRITSDPATVEVVGPESRLKRLTEATTEPVSIRGAQQRVRDVVTVGVSDSALRLTQPQSATVLVEILPAPVERELTGVPIRYRNLGARLFAQVAPSTARVRVRGSRDALNALGADTIDAFVDLYGLGPGRYNLRVQIAPSQNFGAGEISPQVVAVTIR